MSREDDLNDFAVGTEATEVTTTFDGATADGRRCVTSNARVVETTCRRRERPAQPSFAGQANPAQATAKHKADQDSSDWDNSQRGQGHDRRAKYVPEATLRAELAQLEALSNSALAGDLTAIDKIRIALDRSPHVWRHIADLQVAVEIKMIRLFAGDSPLKQEAFRKRCSELRRQLVDDGDSLLIKMAISRVVCCWIFAQYLELRLLSSADQHDAAKQLLHAERRLATAIRTLALARQSERQRQQFAEQN